MGAPYHSDREYLEDELAWLDLVLRRGIGRARAGRDRWGGLCISDEGVDKMVETTAVGNGDARQGAVRASDEPASGEAEVQLDTTIEAAKSRITERTRAALQSGVALRLPRLARLFALSPFEQDVVLLCLAPELDLKYERLYAYLHDDAGRRTPSVDLVMRLLCRGADETTAARESFLPSGRLSRYCMVDVVRGEAGRPLLARTLELDERIADYLLGGSRVEGWLGSSLRFHPAPARAGDPDAVAAAGPLLAPLQQYLARPHEESWLAVLHGPDRLERERTAQALAAAVGLPLLAVDLEAIAEGPLPFEVALRKAFREAALHQAVLCIGGADTLQADLGKAGARGRSLELALADLGWITFISGQVAWDPPDSIKRRWLFFREFPLPSFVDRRRLWEAALDGQVGPDVDAGALAAGFRLTVAGVFNAVAGARNQARLRGDGVGPLVRADLHAACRAESSRGLQRFATRISTSYGWDDLVLPAEPKQHLGEIVDFIRFRERISTDWGFGKKHVLGKGTNVLFTGASGTGKTMAAGIMAADLGLEIYKVDLSTVVSKYIGDTEKNLGRVFGEAETANAVLFFDEADALFGRRSEVKDSHDRYANIEVNYLLQKMEEHEGIVVLATNMSKNMDEAFLRRLQFTVAFPFPEEAERLRIWQRVFPSEAPLDRAVRLDFLSRRLKVAGGNIKNIALGAAFLARGEGESITMRHLVLAAKREFQKMGKICARADFGDYYELVA